MNALKKGIYVEFYISLSHSQHYAHGKIIIIIIGVQQDRDQLQRLEMCHSTKTKNRLFHSYNFRNK